MGLLSRFFNLSNVFLQIYFILIDLNRQWRQWKSLLFINAFSPLLVGVGRVPKVTHFTIGVFPAQPRAARGGGEKRVSSIYTPGISTYLHIRTPATLTMMQPTAFLTSSPLSDSLSPHCWLFIAQISFPHLFRGRIVDSLVQRRKWRHGWGNEERASSINPQNPTKLKSTVKCAA